MSPPPTRKGKYMCTVDILVEKRQYTLLAKDFSSKRWRKLINDHILLTYWSCPWAGCMSDRHTLHPTANANLVI